MTPEADPWKAVSAARLPAAGLAALAAVRHLPGIGVQLEGDCAWVHWPAGRIDVVRCLLPVAGLRFYRQDGDEWVPFNGRLPTSERPPTAETKPLASTIVPDRLEPRVATDNPLSPLRLGAVRGGPPRPATALVALVRDLAAWADTATTRDLSRVRVAIGGDRAVLLGEGLPAIPNAVRYWGESVFVPLGFQTEPALLAETIREAVGAGNEELVFLSETEVEIVPNGAFVPATRAAVRMAISHRTPAAP